MPEVLVRKGEPVDRALKRLKNQIAELEPKVAELTFARDRALRDRDFHKQRAMTAQDLLVEQGSTPPAVNVTIADGAVQVSGNSRALPSGKWNRSV